MPHKRINFGTRISAAQQTTNHRGVATHTHTHTPLARLMLIEMHGLDCPFSDGIVIVFGLKWSVKRARVCQKSLGINHILQFGKVHASAKRYLDTSIHRYNAKHKRVPRKCKYKCWGGGSWQPSSSEGGHCLDLSSGHLIYAAAEIKLLFCFYHTL